MRKHSQNIGAAGEQNQPQHDSGNAARPQGYCVPELTEELIASYTETTWAGTYEINNDFDSSRAIKAAGFQQDGRFVGCILLTIDDDNRPWEDGYVLTFCGIVKDEYELDSKLLERVPQILWGEELTQGEPYQKSDHATQPQPPELLTEYDADGRLTFIGTQKNGVRHGLGAELSYDGNGNIEDTVFSLWQNGKRTHIRSDKKLIPCEA